MNMKDHLALCKRKARQMKSAYPELGFNKRLDIAAQEQCFKHYTALKKMHDLLGPDKSPSRLEIVMAGGNPADSPYEAIDVTTTISHSGA